MEIYMDKKRQPIVAIKTFGCKVNRYESEAILESFKKEGYTVAGEEDFADVYVINTCTVTKLSDRKSRQYIRRVKRINPESITCVVGCYAQVSPEEVAAIQGVDIIAGTNEKLNLYKFVEEKIDMSIDDNESLTAEKPPLKYIEYDSFSSGLCSLRFAVMVYRYLPSGKFGKSVSDNMFLSSDAEIGRAHV